MITGISSYEQTDGQRIEARPVLVPNRLALLLKSLQISGQPFFRFGFGCPEAWLEARYRQVVPQGASCKERGGAASRPSSGNAGITFSKFMPVT